MTENLQPPQTLPEVVSMRVWIEQEVIGKKTCPPLVKLAQDYRGMDRNLNWNALSQEVEIVSLLQLSGDELLRTATASYLGCVKDVAREEGPLTKLFVLPDFPTNDAYDQFIYGMKEAAIHNLVYTQEGRETASVAFFKIANQRKLPRDEVKAVLTGGNKEVTIASNIVDEFVMPIHFYGRKITKHDLVSFPGTRGEVERQQMLSRAPYYAFQVINIMRSGELERNLNRERVEAHNTQVALATDVVRYEGVMRKIRARR